MGTEKLEFAKEIKELIEGSTIDQLKELAYGHVAEIDQYKKTISEQDKVILELNSELDKKSTEVETKSKVVKIGNVKYKVNIPKFRMGNITHSADELESNKELAKALLAIDGQGVITEIK